MTGATKVSTSIGSPLYMAPEQILGRPVDCRTDVYGLGITLYELVSGYQPFNPRGKAEYLVLDAHVNEVPEPPTVYRFGIPQTIVDAVMRSLAKDPEARFRSADEFAQALPGLTDPATAQRSAPAAVVAGGLTQHVQRVAGLEQHARRGEHVLGLKCSVECVHEQHGDLAIPRGALQGLLACDARDRATQPPERVASPTRQAAPTRRSGSQLTGVEVLPPALCGPYLVSSRSACSMRTSFQSTSSSSAIIMGRWVFTPWPISGFLAMIVTMPSAATRTNALGRKVGAGACGACAKSSEMGSR